jgi:predicted MPP superfamily phosphohydrolase
MTSNTLHDLSFSYCDGDSLEVTPPMSDVWLAFYQSLPKIAWASDIHLNMLSENAAKIFGECIHKETGADKLIISGDITESHSLIRTLKDLRDGFGGTIYFVLGNHDYWGSGIERTRKLVKREFGKSKRLVWLDSNDAINLNGTAILGSGGIYDVRLGLGTRSSFELRDFILIDEFGHISTEDIAQIARSFADKWAEESREKLQRAALSYDRILFVTHVPPFPGASWYQRAPSSQQSLPFYTNYALGNVLADVASAHPKVQFLVLCGHTHSGGTYDHFDNLRIIAAKAVYRLPDVYKVFGT